MAKRRRDSDDEMLTAYERRSKQRLRGIGNVAAPLEESDPEETEARIRRMFYGAKVERARGPFRLHKREERSEDTDD